MRMPEKLGPRARSALRGAEHAAGLAGDALARLGQAAAPLAGHRLAPTILHALFAGLAVGLAGIAADDYLLAAMRGVAVDRSGYIWLAWAPLPLAIAAMAWAAAADLGAPFFSRGAGARAPLLLPAAAVAAFVWLELRIAAPGPLAHVAVRASAEHAAIALSAIALWTLARRSVSAALLAWVAALVAVFLARVPLSAAPWRLRPDLAPILGSIVAGVFILASAPPRRAPPPRAEAEGALRLIPAAVQAAAIMLGALVGLASWKAILLNTPADSTVSQTFELLWSRSALFGWGRARLLRMTEVAAQPMQIEMPEWTGFMGLAAAGGVLHIIVIVSLAAYALHAATGDAEDRRTGYIKLICLTIFQAVIWMMLLGGPNSAVPAWLAAGWLALALGPPAPQAGQAEHPRWARFHSVGSVLALVLLIVLAGAAARPFWARGILSSIGAKELANPDTRFRIARAKRLDPLNPRAHLTEAAYHREQLTLTRGWDENLYQRIVSAYETAHDLDGYDPLIVLRQADVQLKARRVDDALRTAQRALALAPAWMDVIEWVYLTAEAEDRPSAAQAMIRQALRVDPASERWWRRKFAAEAAAGRAAEAESSLAAALTAPAEENAAARAELVQAAFARARP